MHLYDDNHYEEEQEQEQEEESVLPVAVPHSHSPTRIAVVTNWGIDKACDIATLINVFFGRTNATTQIRQPSCRWMRQVARGHTRKHQHRRSW
mmetsp:Transcript_8111/g.20107  ORF Transcript_8111/g.20107 Transcript_8111/m.20107 type:complete len:93 (-) Transcript_8111:409-687(-)